MQPGTIHLEHRDLVRRTETVLLPMQDAEAASGLALEKEDDVNHMLEDLRTGDGPVLRHMTDEEDGDAALLRGAQQLSGRLTHLTDRARSRRDALGIHRLDRVDDDEVRFFLPDGLDDVLDIRFRHEVKISGDRPNALCTQLDLLEALLTGDIENRFSIVRCQISRYLEKDRRFSDARVTTEQYHRAHDDTTAEHTIELLETGRDTILLFEGDFIDTHRSLPRRTRAGVSAEAGSRRCFYDRFLHEGIPCAAARTLTEPLRRFIATFLTEVARCTFRHSISSYKQHARTSGCSCVAVHMIQIYLFSACSAAICVASIGCVSIA